MSLDSVVNSLPKELGPVLDKIAGRAVVVTASASNNTARDNAVQICGPVAGTIQYVFNLNLNYHTGESDTCWRLVGGNGAAEILTSKRRPQMLSETSEQTRQDRQSLAVQAPKIRQVHWHDSGQGFVPVRALYDQSIEGNWIAAGIVKRLKLRYKQANVHKDVPAILGQTQKKTRIFVDLTYGKKDASNQRYLRFYVINHCKAFDMLLGARP